MTGLLSHVQVADVLGITPNALKYAVQKFNIEPAKITTGGVRRRRWYSVEQIEQIREARATLRHQVRFDDAAEDLEMLLKCGEQLVSIAPRLGYKSADSLERRMAAHGYRNLRTRPHKLTDVAA